ncbi:MAG: DUF190 domain-containing protein [Actinomycetota bacterium]|nr:DUF190 domain-containing protein [Actinomycetota bacterium]
MTGELIKLTAYFGERDRAGGRYLTDALAEIFARGGIHTSLVLRGAEGFGVKHHLRDDRLLTLSEDLPLAAVAVDFPAAIGAALADVQELRFDGLLTLERAQLASARALPQGGAGKLTLYAGRHQRVDGAPLHRVAVEIMHRHEMSAAAVLLGVDGTMDGARQRAGFLSANEQVPLMIIGVGEPGPVQGALGELDSMGGASLSTLQCVRLCRREGASVQEPHRPPGRDGAGREIWQKLMVHTEEASRYGGHPQHVALVRGLRRAGARGATCLRGLWGYQRPQPPHGDSFWQLRRRVPVVTVVVDAPERIAELYGIVERVTAGAGVVTSELIPASRATGPGISLGSLRLADL